MAYPKRDQNSPLAQELRGRGYLPLPRLWVRSADMDVIKRITDLRAEEVNAVRSELRKAGLI